MILFEVREESFNVSSESRKLTEVSVGVGDTPSPLHMNMHTHTDTALVNLV